MNRGSRLLAIASGTAVTAMAATGAALAAAPAPGAIQIARTGLGSAPRVFVDSHKTVSVVWIDSDASDDTTLGYARKTAGATHFTTSALPGQAVSGADSPFIYEPSPGVLEIIAEVDARLAAWRSTDDGQSWTQMDASALNALSANGVYVVASELVDAPGGPITYAGSDGDPSGQVVQLKDDLSGVTPVATNTQGLSGGVQVARTAAAVFLFGGAVNDNTLPFQVGGTTGQIVFPTCSTGHGIAGDTSIATGPAGVVVAATDCGKVWTRTVSDSGLVGNLVTVGTGDTTDTDQAASQLQVALSSHLGSDLTLTYIGADGDLTVEHSTDGTRWSAARGRLAVATAASNSDGFNGALATGTPAWYGFTAQPSTTSSVYTVSAIPLSATYLPPTAPSGTGISHPRHAVRGSLAVTVPGVISRAAFARTGRVTVRLKGAIADHVTASIETTYTANHVENELCSGTTRTSLSVGQTRTVTLVCAGGGVVIGGTASSGIAARAGDIVTFTFSGRNGPLTVSSRVG